MTFQEIKAMFDSGSLDDDLGNIIEAAQLRRKHLEHQKIWTLKPGDRIQLNKRVRPHYLIGATGKITKVMQSYVMVDFDIPYSGPNGKTWHRNVRIPVSLLDDTKSESVPV